MMHQPNIMGRMEGGNLQGLDVIRGHESGKEVGNPKQDRNGQKRKHETNVWFMERGHLRISDVNRGHEPKMRKSLEINETNERFMGSHWVCLAVLCFGFVAPFAAEIASTNWVATNLIRGPYLQMGTHTNMIVRWRTDTEQTTKVRYGLSAQKLDQTAQGPGKIREHVVLLTGLKFDTTYYYTIGDDDKVLAGGGGKPFAFTTAPRPGTRQKVRTWVIGDSGTANASAAAVRDAYEKFNGARRTDLWLMLGDNAYPNGTDAEYQKAIFKMYTNMLPRCVLWPTLGNHDSHSASSATQSGPYFDIFTLPTLAQAGGLASGTEAYYSYDYANVHFICLDSQDSERSPSGAMGVWLRHDLSATQQDWLVAYFHHPPYTKGSHDSDNVRDSAGRMRDMRQNILPLLEAGGVDLVLTGHSHAYERSFLIDGYYGKSKTLEPRMLKDKGDGREEGSGAYRKSKVGPKPHEGAVYTVAGSAGQTSGGKLNHPAMYVSLNVLGSLVLDFDGARLDAAFLDDRAEIRDRFTVLKGSPSRRGDR